ncbi:flagellin [Planococcus antarcticus DSM 14505]|uniref:Flagellin n=1 Tax=Planococcus antarcticus DSM 14505 TaxID=1185653 RepID=A0ABM6D1M9_9BACL|nr:flagellin [Planococcus antarcticus]ANU09197.1 flagellin [Planococcus antarcticus DSM 14505]
MIINHNIAALNTHRQMGSAQSAQMDSMEKLSSGLRINSAKDDAAGLTISEKMRGQIRGLEQASTNAQDGISLIQTAEGTLSVTQDILQRMRELSVQSANDTNTDTDRGEIQKEMDQLIEEIDRIGNTTEFNAKKLLDGGLSGTSSTTEGVKVNSTDASFASAVLTAAGTSEDNTYNVKVTGVTRDATGAVTGYNLSWEDKAGVTGAATDIAAGDVQVIGSFDVTLGAADSMKVGDELTFTSSTASFDDVDTSLSLQIGANSSQTINIGIGDMRAGALKVAGLDVTSSQSAQASITVINNAIESVSSERSKLGATQNRLDHTINNLDTSAENLTSAESRIRDVDYAEAA